MKINYQFLCILLILCIGYLLANKNSSINIEQAVLNNIFERKSVRSYTTESVSDEILTTLVKAGMAAPTAGNMQPWEFIAVNDTNLLKEYATVNPNAQMALKAPAAIVVLANLNTYEARPEMAGYWHQDTSAATQNILLAAEAMGLGAVWTGVYNGGYSQDRIRGAKKIFNLPDNLIPLAVIIIGYPDGETLPKDKWKPEKLYWNTIQ